MRSRIFAAITLALAFILTPGLRGMPQEGSQGRPAEPASGPAVLNNPQSLPEVSTLRNTARIGSDYVIGPEDVLRVEVFDVPELSNLTLRVANDGTIAPLLGHVQAAGLTTSKVRQELESKWGHNYLQNPQVSVFVQEFHAQPVSIVGAVENPGLYQLTGPRSLIEMLSQAGGLAKRSSAPAGRTVYVTHRGGSQDLQPVDGMHLLAPDKVEIDLRKLFYSKEDALNITIHPSDIISVSKADIVYVTGRGVTRPGGFVLEDRDNVTVFQALAMAEALTSNAAKHDARTIRQKPDGSKLEIPIDTDKVLKGQALDPVLAANDVLIRSGQCAKSRTQTGS
jgi:polysaccharide biosynthesis/export protein